MTQLLTRFYLVRHGETEENVAGILQGHLPGTLTARGRKQVAALRESLATAHFDAILSSDLKRAADTAEILNEGLHLPLTLTPLLRERDWGGLTGCPYKQARVDQFPADVESLEAMFERAGRFLSFAWDNYAGQRVLVVTHGLYARCIQAVHGGLTLRDVPRMENTEVRLVEMKNAPVLVDRGVEGPDVVSAN